MVITAVWTSGGSLRKRRATARQQAVDILQRIGDGFYALDSEERLTYVNPQTEQLWGLSREQLVGNRLWDVFPQAIGTHAPGAPASSTSASSPTGTTVYFRDISARKQAEDAAQEAVRVRDDVLRAVSHDLRNPLSAVKGHGANPRAVGAQTRPAGIGAADSRSTSDRCGGNADEQLD